MQRDLASKRARDLRRQLTDTERLIWATLRNRRFDDVKFRRQVVLGDYIVDFVCFERRLIIELDGDPHLQQQRYDAERTRWLEEQGFCVVRFWNQQLWEDMPAVEEAIWQSLHGRPPQDQLPDQSVH